MPGRRRALLGHGAAREARRAVARMARGAIRGLAVVVLVVVAPTVPLIGPAGPARPALAQETATPATTEAPSIADPPAMDEPPTEPLSQPAVVRAPIAGAPTGQVTAATLFPDLPLAGVQNAVLPGSVKDDHQILLGGVGSDLWHAPGDPPGELWMVTDRGPRGRDDNGKDRQAFAVPEYTPMILHVRIGESGVDLLETIPVVGQSGQPVTGLPNLEGRDERPVDFRAKAKLPYNPSGLDPEGLVRTPDGDFWIAEEYGPSLVHLSAGGTVLKRFVPEGVALDGADYPVAMALPAVLGKRSEDQGFEALTASPDGGTLYLAMQGPLSNPTNSTSERSRHARVLVFDVASEQVTAEYVYRFESIRLFDPSKKADPEDMKLSAIALCAGGQLLVLERTPNAARLYLADRSAATNILGTRWDDLATRPSLEASDSLAAIAVLPLAKTLALDLTALPGVPDKLEGIAIVDPTTIVVANDNDFDVTRFDGKGNNVGKGERSQLVTISLGRPLP
jgi:hypothetical protein